ncbi:toprim domain-containing protein [Thermoproteota archaeon]
MKNSSNSSGQDIINDWLTKLRISDKLIIVEGIKDRKALEGLDIPGSRIMTMKKPIYQVVEEIAEQHKEAIILTDFDKKGKELYGRLKKDLLRHGVRIDSYFREFLQKNTKLSHIEGIKTYFSRL